MLTHSQLVNRLNYNRKTGVFRWHHPNKFCAYRSGDVAGTPHKKGYLVITIDGRPYLAHRLAWFFVTGEWPDKQIDHENGIRSDNRFSNLRKATPSQNMWNSRRPRSNTSGYKGVSWSKALGKWQAQISKHGKRRGLGYFATKEEAHRAYTNAAQDAFGEFARA